VVLVSNYLIIGLCVYNILCYADFKIGDRLMAGPVLNPENWKPTKFWNILLGFVLTVAFWPIPLLIALFCDWETK
jgi:hypothetical protein